MGSGKGNVEYWVAKVQPGKVLFEIEGVDEAIAREAFRLAGAKLSVSTHVRQTAGALMKRQRITWQEPGRTCRRELLKLRREQFNLRMRRRSARP